MSLRNRWGNTKKKTTCSRNLSFESHPKCRPHFFARGRHEGCLNDSLTVVGNKLLYRKFCILQHKVTAKHTHCLAHSRRSKMILHRINIKMTPVAPFKIFQLLSLLQTKSKKDGCHIRTVLNTFWTNSSFIPNYAKWKNKHWKRNAEPSKK